MNKSEFDRKLKELNDKLSASQRKLSSSEKKWLAYLNWDKEDLSEQNVEFIKKLDKQYKNIDKLSDFEKEVIENLKKSHRKTNMVFDSEKTKSWFIYLDVNLISINKKEIKLIRKLTKKEELFPNKLDREEIEALDELIRKYKGEDQSGVIPEIEVPLEEQVKYLLRLPGMSSKERAKFKNYSTGKTCNFCNACEICGEVEELYEFHVEEDTF